MMINTAAKKNIFVMLSGGVDSSVAAALLKERGFDVRGVHIKMWSDPSIPCTTKEDRYDAMRAAAHLGIPFETWDLTAEYKQAVVEYMIAEYAAGRTPNPDVMCNRDIKFGVFLKRALEAGADFVGTGHYVRLQKHLIQERQKAPPWFFDSRERLARPAEAGHRCRSSFKRLKSNVSSANESYALMQAKDLNKDQSYFLWTLTQEQLKHCLFPIGEYIKPEVRAMARELGLPNADKPDSQGVCFIGEFDMREYLGRYIAPRRGAVVTTAGRVVGEHEGIEFYTIGQRHGLSIGGGIPYYVAEKQKETNTLVVAEGPYDEQLFAQELVVTQVNWISGHAPALPFRCHARIRYRQPLQRCKIYKSQTINYNVYFDEPQRAVTPGQSAVLYHGDTMLGGGVIE